jgi:hypothetical protein
VSRLEERREHNGPSGSIPSIPAPLTALIGRASEVQAVNDMLRRARLVTLTGPAGVGKTRTAIELGRRQARQRADGVLLVDLAPVDPTGDVAEAIGLHRDFDGAVEAFRQAVVPYLNGDPNECARIAVRPHPEDSSHQLRLGRLRS